MNRETDHKVNTPIRCGIVGLGRSGWDIHVKCLIENEKYFINAVCDKDSERLAQSIRELKCKGYADYNDFLDNPDIDVVIIATPSKSHYTIAKAALRSKKHVVLEKPLAANIDEVIQLKNLSDKIGRRLIPFFNFRFVQEYQLIKSILKEKLIGQVFLIKRHVSYYNRRDDWQAQSAENGGILNAAAMHHLDQILQIVGEQPIDIWGDLRHVVSKGDAPDHSKILMKFPNGCITDVEVSWAEALPGYPWHIFGSRGAIRQFENTLECKWFNEEDIDEQVNGDRSYFSNERIQWKHKKYTLNKDYALGVTPLFYEQLAESLVYNKEIPVDIQSAIRTMEILGELAY